MYQPPEPSNVGRCLRCSSCIDVTEHVGGICYDCQPAEAGDQPAFPVQASEYGGHGTCFGLTIRDYFAAKALPTAWAAFDGGYFDAGEWDSINRGVAECAYQMADAMLAARVKP